MDPTMGPVFRNMTQKYTTDETRFCIFTALKKTVGNGMDSKDKKYNGEERKKADNGA